MKIVRTTRSVRLVDGPDLVSHLRTKPGPTHGFFDLLAACIAGFAAGEERTPRAALLGFAAGGIVAPLRAMQWHHPLEAVDLSLDAAEIFHEIAREWGGDVHLTQADAAAWMRSRRTRWDVIVEDLTVRGRFCAIKPPVSVEVLPALFAARLSTWGVAATNALPVPELSWDELLAKLAAPHARAMVVTCEEYENRILLAGPGLTTTTAATARLRTMLRRIRSKQADRFTIRMWKSPRRRAGSPSTR